MYLGDRHQPICDGGRSTYEKSTSIVCFRKLCLSRFGKKRPIDKQQYKQTTLIKYYLFKCWPLSICKHSLKLQLYF